MSLKGCRLANHGNFTRGKWFSVLAAMATTGVKVAHSIIGSYDMDQFEFAFEILFYLSLDHLQSMKSAQL